MFFVFVVCFFSACWMLSKIEKIYFTRLQACNFNETEIHANLQALNALAHPALVLLWNEVDYVEVIIVNVSDTYR